MAKLTEPTSAQIKEFLERCGFKHGIPFPDLAEQGILNSEEQWYIHSGIANTKYSYCGAQPPIDLNFLFKYAAPKVRDTLSHRDYRNLMLDWIDEFTAVKSLPTEPDPANSLFWAIWEVIHNESN